MKPESLSHFDLRQPKGTPDMKKLVHGPEIYAHTHSSVKHDMRMRLCESPSSLLNAGMTSDISGKIVTFRRREGINQAEFGERVGVTQGTVSRWEKGANPEPDMLAAIARTIGLSVDELISADGFIRNIRPLGPTLCVKGAVAAGQWVEAFEWPEEDWLTFTGRADVTAEVDHRFGLRVEGDSMNEIYPEGTIVECVSVFGRSEAAPGKRIVILRKREADLSYEATVKEFVEIDGVPWAKPRSKNPAHQAFRLDDPEQGIIEVKVIAVVVSAILPE